MQQFAKYLLIIGLILIITGLILYFFGDKFTWPERLPGDIRIEKDNFRFYFPITTMILLSAVISLIFFIIRKFL